MNILNTSNVDLMRHDHLLVTLVTLSLLLRESGRVSEVRANTGVSVLELRQEDKGS